MAQELPKEKTEFTFIWHIENYSVSSFIRSPIFVAETLGKTKWRLILKSVHNEEQSLGSVTITCLDDTASKLKVGISMSCLSPDGEFLIEKIINNQEFYKGCERNLYLNGFKPDMKTLFLPNDTLTLRCHLWQNDSKSSQAGQCYARSRIAMTRILKVWKIQRFVDFHAKSSQSISLHSGTQWDPLIKLVGFVAKSGYFHIEIKTDKNCTAICKISVLEDGKPGKLSFTEKCELDSKRVYHFRNFIYKGEIEWKMSLLLDFSVFNGRDFSVIEKVNYSNLDKSILDTSEAVTRDNAPTWFPCFCDRGTSMGKQMASLQGDMLKLYIDKQFCDLTLRTEDQTFPVHKAVLCSRSQKFRDIFSNCPIKSETQQAKDKMACAGSSQTLHDKGIELGTNVMDITDVDSFTLNLLLNFMYSDNLEEVQVENIVKLYFASIKYGVFPLKSECLSLLKSSLKLSVTNVCEVLVLSDGLEGDKIRKMAEDFFDRNVDKILVSDGWKLVMEKSPQLASQLMQKVLLASYRKLV